MNPLDILFALFVSAGQWRLARMFWAAVWQRYSGRKRTAIVVAALLGETLMVMGFLVTVGVMRRLSLLSQPVFAAWSAVSYIWLFTSSLGCYVYALFGYLSRWIARQPFDSGRRRALSTAGGALVAAPFAVVGYGAFIQRTDFRVRQVDLPVPGLPRDLEGLRLLHLSDIHLSPFLSERELAGAIEEANGTRPHVALVTGDLISSRGDPLDACLRQVARLRSDSGILACMGNHEIYAGAEDYAAEEGARMGIRFLRSQARQLRFGSAVLNVAGVDYQPLRDKSRYLEGAEKLVAPGSLNILLSHNPDVFPIAAAKGFDLTLAGHTHGGQVTIEILNQSINPARFVTPFIYGLYHWKQQRRRALAYVTRGIGTVGVPARIGAPPEISLLRLRRA